MLFRECSAKTQVGIQRVFEELARQILERPQLWDPDYRKGPPPGLSLGGPGDGDGDGADGTCGGYCVTL